MPNLKKVFKVTVDEKELELAILKPSAKDQTDAQKVYDKTWTDLVIRDKVMVRVKMFDVLKEQGVWTDLEQKELEELQTDLSGILKKLSRGGAAYKTIGLAKDDALLAQKKRSRLYELSYRRNCLDQMTAEGRAELARLNYLIYACTVYNTDSRRYFLNTEDYLEKADSPVGVLATTEFLTFVNDVDLDFDQKFPENVFLKKYGLNTPEKEQVVEPEPPVEFTPFVDDEGNEVKPLVDDESAPKG